MRQFTKRQRKLTFSQCSLEDYQIGSIVFKKDYIHFVLLVFFLFSSTSLCPCIDCIHLSDTILSLNNFSSQGNAHSIICALKIIEYKRIIVTMIRSYFIACTRRILIKIEENERTLIDKCTFSLKYEISKFNFIHIFMLQLLSYFDSLILQDLCLKGKMLQILLQILKGKNFYYLQTFVLTTMICYSFILKQREYK